MKDVRGLRHLDHESGPPAREVVRRPDTGEDTVDGADQGALGRHVAPDVREAVNAYVDRWPGVHVILQARSSLEPERGIAIVLASDSELPPRFEEDLVRTVRAVRGDQAIVRVYPLATARMSSAREAPDAERGPVPHESPSAPDSEEDVS